MGESEIVDRYLYAAAILKRIIPELDVRCRSGTAHPGGEPLLKPCFVLYHPNDKKTNVKLDNVAEFEAFAMGVEFLSKMNRPTAAPDGRKNIIMNGQPFALGFAVLNKHQICHLLSKPYRDDLTFTYRYASGGEGSLSKAGEIILEDGLVITVADTGNA